MFISFEGVDGCGKTTQVSLLREALESAGHRVMVLREPGNTPISEAIRSILLSKDHFDLAPRAELLLFAAARAQLVQTVIRPALAEGRVVICDRYVDSTLAYQAFGRELPMGDVEKVNMIATSGLMPDATIYLKVSVEQALGRMAAEAKYEDRMEAAGLAFFERVARGYDIVSQNFSRFITVNGALSIDDVHDEIVRKLLDRFPSLSA